MMSVKNLHSTSARTRPPGEFQMERAELFRLGSDELVAYVQDLQNSADSEEHRDAVGLVINAIRQFNEYVRTWTAARTEEERQSALQDATHIRDSYKPKLIEAISFYPLLYRIERTAELVTQLRGGGVPADPRVVYSVAQTLTSDSRRALELHGNNKFVSSAYDIDKLRGFATVAAQALSALETSADEDELAAVQDTVDQYIAEVTLAVADDAVTPLVVLEDKFEQTHSKIGALVSEKDLLDWVEAEIQTVDTAKTLWVLYDFYNDRLMFQTDEPVASSLQNDFVAAEAFPVKNENDSSWFVELILPTLATHDGPLDPPFRPPQKQQLVFHHAPGADRGSWDIAASHPHWCDNVAQYTLHFDSRTNTSHQPRVKGTIADATVREPDGPVDIEVALDDPNNPLTEFDRGRLIGFDNTGPYAVVERVTRIAEGRVNLSLRNANVDDFARGTHVVVPAKPCNVPYKLRLQVVTDNRMTVVSYEPYTSLPVYTRDLDGVQFGFTTAGGQLSYHRVTRVDSHASQVTITPALPDGLQDGEFLDATTPAAALSVTVFPAPPDQ